MFKLIYPNKELSISNLKRRSHIRFDMEALNTLGQAARKEIQFLSKVLEERLDPMKMDRVSNWANRAQVCRPHLWCYYRAPEDQFR
ncbi:protein of unknown function [Streptococcus thermophilus]|nr:protein of unknown function [Streptococcus thermophilus]